MVSLVCSAQWEDLGSGMNGGVRKLLYHPGLERVYAFGHFGSAGGAVVNGTAYWENEVWYPMGLGMHNTQIYPVMNASFWGDSILIAGSFPYAYGVPYSQNVAIWDGAAWSAIQPGGVDAFIPAVISNADGLTVAGQIASIAGIPIANNVARFTGGTWSSACVHPTDGILWFSTMAYYQGKYILGGNLNSPTLRELCWLDGDTLRRVGQGILGDAWVNDLQEYQGKLYIAGDYNTASGNAATSLSTWDGQDFANPFPQVYFTTQANDIDVFGGELYFSGRVQLLGSSDYYALARYDGERLCLFGKNLNTVFLSIAATEEYLYVAPNMITLGLGGDTVNYIARWDLDILGDTCIQIATVIREPEPLGADWAISPTPFSDQLFISCSAGIPSGSRFEITDVAGRMLSAVSLNMAGPNEQVALRPRTASEGVVIATIRDQHGAALARKRLIRISH